MLITHEREKLINAILYFAENTKNCGKTKLFKLLFLLDFEHYQQTGRSITGQNYFAWKRGPVPVALDDEIDEPELDLENAVAFQPEQVFQHIRLKVVARKAFESSLFSKRELRLLESVAKQYKDQLAKDMVEVTHAENSAWERVYANGRGYNDPIPYELALSGEGSAVLLSMAREHQALKLHYQV